MALGLAFAVVLCCLGVAAPASGVAPHRGLNIAAPSGTDAKSLDEVQSAGANTVRFELSWAQLEPTAPAGGVIATDPSYVAQVDSVISAAAARGIRAILVLQETPCWASSAPDSQRAPCVASATQSDYSRYAPVHASDYAAIAGWVAQRWGTQLAALELWNEPNFTGFFTVNDPATYTGPHSLWVSDPGAPGASGQQAAQAADEARTYVQLAQAAYPAIKAQAPSLTVLGGVLAYSASGFLGRMYADGFRGTYDAVAIHPYDDRPLYERTGNVMMSYQYGVPDVHRVMSDNGDGDVPLWLTEFGWPTCAPNVMDWCVSDADQASRLTEAFDEANGWPYVDALVVYTLRDPGTDPNNFQDNMGLLHNDWSAKPGWQAFVDALAPPPEPPDAQTPPPPPPAPAASFANSSVPLSAQPAGLTRKHYLHLASVRRVRRVDAHHVAVDLVCRSSATCGVRVELMRGKTLLKTFRVKLRRHAHRTVVVRLRGVVPRTLRVLTAAI